MADFYNPPSIEKIGTKSAKADAYDNIVRGKELSDAQNSGLQVGREEGLIAGEMARREAALQSQADFAQSRFGGVQPYTSPTYTEPSLSRREAALDSQAEFAGGLAGAQ